MDSGGVVQFQCATLIKPLGRKGDGHFPELPALSIFPDKACCLGLRQKDSDGLPMLAIGLAWHRHLEIADARVDLSAQKDFDAKAGWAVGLD